jgi:hypothetical protein
VLEKKKYKRNTKKEIEKRKKQKKRNRNRKKEIEKRNK